MSFLNKLNDTYELLNKFDNVVIGEIDKSLVKKHLLFLSEDLARYKNIDKQNIEFNKDEIESKITNLLDRIYEIETNVKNKLIITEKYNSYLNS